MRHKKNFGWICAVLLCGILFPLQAQDKKKDNHFEISKNLEIFNSLVKEMEMFYVDTIDVDKTVQRGIDAMLRSLLSFIPSGMPACMII